MKKIFYAEDDAAIARSVQEYLQQQDYEVDIFPTAARTRQALLSETAGSHPGGLGTCRMRTGTGCAGGSAGGGESLPVIFLTVPKRRFGCDLRF